MALDERPSDHAERMQRAKLALDGLSVGDAFGQQFFYPATEEASLRSRTPPPPYWRYTDDTEMALGICEVLEQRGYIDQDMLAEIFARRYGLDQNRGYGAGARDILCAIQDGGDWRQVSAAAFGGGGSLGNGGAMRVAPVGAYFADDFAAAAEQARHSAAITHAHPEGQAGAIAVAVASAWAWQWRQRGGTDPPAGLLEAAIELTPSGTTRRGIQSALQLDLDEWEFTVAEKLGNGSQITAPDTVPFCLWCAAANLGNYCDALWTAVRVGGDLDTTCAIVGGIVALAVGHDAIPDTWLRSREGLCFSTE